MFAMCGLHSPICQLRMAPTQEKKVIPVPAVCTGALSRHSPPDGCMCHSDCRKWKFRQTASTPQLGVAVFNHEDKAQSPGNGI